MKGFCVLFLIYLSIGVKVNAEDDKEQIGMMKDMAKGLSEDCKIEEGATDADVEDMIENRETSSPKSKCLRKCMMKSFNMMSDDGEILINNFMELVEMISEGREDVISKAKEIVESCKDVHDQDHCEKAFKFGMCLEQKAKELGLY